MRPGRKQLAGGTPRAGTGNPGTGTVRWTPATVVENRDACLDGSLRLLRLSVEDRVQYLDGRKVRQIQNGRRWRDDYEVPGQSLALKFCCQEGRSDVSTCPPEHAAVVSFTLASSPTRARAESAGLDATLVEVLVEGDAGDEAAAALMHAAPGTFLEVSPVLGRGFCSPVAPGRGLLAALEERRPLLLIAAGARGAAALRSAMSWAPLQAHAGAAAVTVAVVAPRAAQAPFLEDWQAWREMGVHVHVIYQDAFPSAGLSNGVAGATDGVHGAAGPASGDEGVEAFGTGRDDDQAASPLSLCSALDSLLGRGPAGLRNLLGASSKDVCVMLSGVRSSDGAELARRLRKAGVHARRILVAERVMAPPPTQAQAPRKSL